MRVIKPTWLSHSGEQKDFEVYSCHVSSDGKRLATAGGDGHVRVWSTEAIYGDANGDAEGKPRQLCHMSHHLGTIHSVRFSPNGRYLASGADDKLICVYHLDKNPPVASFGLGAEPPPVENWKTYKRLVGHENDVQDLAWSYDSSILVSVGLDSKIVVWSGHSFEKLKTITVHSSHVKGITFDPANKFFATASDDRTIKIFRFTPPAPNATQHDMVNNFVLEQTISGPFKSSPLTTYFRRCSWSPDGNHIAAPNAVNGPVSSVAIIERTRWDSEINLIGHEGPTEVCMFSPRLFHTENPAEQPDNNALVTVIASAGQDKTLSIWNTNTSRPVVILQDVASKSISDLAWSPDGTTIFAASLDGTLLGISLDHGELGWVADAGENDKALQKYGASRKGMGIAEDIEGLNLENQSKAGESRAAESRMGALMGDPGSSKAATPATNGTKPVGNGTATGTSTPRPTNGNVEPEKEREKPAEENGDKSGERVKELKSRVTVGKDGRKRVAPLLVSSSGTGQSSLPQTQLVGSTSTSKAAQNDTPQTILDLERPFEGLPKGGVAAMLLGNKRKTPVIEGEDEEDPASKRQATGPTPVVLNGVDGVEPASVVPAAYGVVPTPEYLRPAVLNPSIAFAQIRLAVPKVRSQIVRPLERGVLLPESSTDDASKVPENIILEARNPAQIRDPSFISATKRGTLLWQDYLPRAVILVTGNKNFWAVACEDGSIYTWTPAGRRLMNPIIMESQPVILECRNNYLLCINAVGLCHVWDLQRQAALHPPVSLGPVLELATTSLNLNTTTPGPGITSAQLNSAGHIVVTLTNGDGYCYTRDMFTWQRVSEAWWAVGSQYWNSNDSSIGALQSTAVGPVTPAKPKDDSTANVSAGIIPYLERHTTNEFLLKGRAYTLQRIVKMLLTKDGFEGFESTVSIAHLENRIAAALHLDARDEFRLYLFMYAKRLGAEGHRGKVEELLNSLLGGILRDTDEKPSEGGRGWFSQEDEICGWDRKELLKGVVMILGKFRELQRLTIQYARVLDLNLESDGAMEIEA
ncbi:WD domain-containing protein [Colletotrichum scovillei]|uniref:Protein HIR n=1 Tax=Colletotrichum scovillei TaxID=1209932 RepID=A0A9P7UAK2_9PEZI|nr:WD domain-containing protein [Colletotrichum scovillei]KAF4775848.1 WD domain-containing protein [Colletotrichum scovillei]KAG7047336.1 Protein HIR1 [Colletotrichum scovillei]KAG7059653.1 Protein HIR1 [Colletotrichum scovillei]KAG7067102.1 Protein HIR1 [Colletotrichum scovillei]